MTPSAAFATRRVVAIVLHAVNHDCESVNTINLRGTFLRRRAMAASIVVDSAAVVSGLGKRGLLACFVVIACTLDLLPSPSFLPAVEPAIFFLSFTPFYALHLTWPPVFTFVARLLTVSSNRSS